MATRKSKSSVTAPKRVRKPVGKTTAKEAPAKEAPTKTAAVKKRAGKKTVAKKFAAIRKTAVKKKDALTRNKSTVSLSGKRRSGKANTAIAARSAQTRRALTLHKSISQIASIRLQTEILQLEIRGKSKLAEEMRVGLQDIVDLTKTVQESLYELLQAESPPAD
ncbi:MAG: hypothetical protein AAF529_05085 [Pseudomonadota bacterium]